MLRAGHSTPQRAACRRCIGPRRTARRRARRPGQKRPRQSRTPARPTSGFVARHRARPWRWRWPSCRRPRPAVGWRSVPAGPTAGRRPACADTRRGRRSRQPRAPRRWRRDDAASSLITAPASAELGDHAENLMSWVAEEYYFACRDHVERLTAGERVRQSGRPCGTCDAASPTSASTVRRNVASLAVPGLAAAGGPARRPDPDQRSEFGHRSLDRLGYAGYRDDSYRVGYHASRVSSS
jgi:hypothetical protein